MSMPGFSEWIVIAVAILILFGAKKIPEFMRGLGKGMREFNNAKDDLHRNLNDSINESEMKTVK